MTRVENQFQQTGLAISIQNKKLKPFTTKGILNQSIT
jgi:hypothetical protein